MSAFPHGSQGQSQPHGFQQVIPPFNIPETNRKGFCSNREAEKLCCRSEKPN